MKNKTLYEKLSGREQIRVNACIDQIALFKKQRSQAKGTTFRRFYNNAIDELRNEIYYTLESWRHK